MKFRIDNDKELLIVTDATKIEYYQLKLHLTRHVNNYRFQPKFKMGLWDGTISHFKDGQIDLGLWKECFKLCKMNDWKFEIENKQDFPIDKDITYEKVLNFCKSFFKDYKLKNGEDFFPYEHQIVSAYKILKNRFCLIEVGTGGGKSLIFSIVMFYSLNKINKDAKFLLIVPNISLVTQFYDDCLDYLYGFSDEFKNRKDVVGLNIEEIMSDKPRRSEHEANLFIGTIQSLEKRPKSFFKQFYSITTDESHKSGQGSGNEIKQVSKVLKKTVGSAHMRFGMSGTFPGDETLDFMTIQSLHGPKVNIVEAKELMDKGIITPVKIKALLLNYGNTHFNDNLALIKRGGDGKKVYDLEKKYVHNSIKRMDFVVDKLISNITKNTLVLFNIKEYGKAIYERVRALGTVDVFYIDGDVKSADRDYIKKKMDETKLGDIINEDGIKIKYKPKILVASYGTLSTGVSVKNLYNVIFMESFKSEQIVIQSIGRILRLHKGKSIAQVFDIVDIFDNQSVKKNMLYNHYTIRKSFYDKRKYPYGELKINL